MVWLILVAVVGHFVLGYLTMLFYLWWDEQNPMFINSDNRLEACLIFMAGYVSALLLICVHCVWLALKAIEFIGGWLQYSGERVLGVISGKARH